MSSNRRSVRLAQTTVDARLNTDFEHLGNSFDYSVTVSASAENLPPVKEKVTAYLQQIQKGKLIQPFGCLLAIDEKNFQIIACSENASEMLTVASTHAVPTLGDNNPGLGIGTDVRTLFTSPSSTALQKAIGFADVSLLNPILLHCKPSGKPFYGIMHRVTGCLVIDFEPVKPCDLPITAAGALQSYKLAAKAISRLQSLPTGSMKRLCDTIVEEVFHLTGYDRVMAYKFHEDDHGEVVSELTKPGLEPYLGLHYPATDIPQASRFLFMKNKVRIICDCHAKPVKVNQDDRLDSDLTFCGSTLRAPHGCHTQYMENMNSIASLVLAVVVNENEDVANPSEPNPPESNKKRLWGLVVCHNRSPRFVPFPLRYACEFLAQVFATHVNMEFELENQIHEKNILRTQTLLCDMLMRDALPGIMSQTPNIMNLVKCDGAALMCRGKIWRLGNCPLEHEIMSIADWLAECHMDSTGLSTDSLHDAGYPGALSLGNQICGMAAARINSRDIVFWFRSHTASEIRWGGAKHEAGDQDDGRRMHPRSSFNAFLEVVKTRSFPWKDFEMDAIHSLQLILRGNFTDGEKNGKKKNEEEEENSSMNIDGSGKKDERFAAMLELQTVTSEMVRLIETATVPIFAVDADGCVNGWNLKIAELTGLQVEQAMGKNILSLVEDNSIDTVKSILKQALEGKKKYRVILNRNHNS